MLCFEPSAASFLGKYTWDIVVSLGALGSEVLESSKEEITLGKI